MCQLSNSPGLSGDGGEGLRLLRLVGELEADEAGETSLVEEGGEGGDAGRSLRGDFFWRRYGRAEAVETSLLVNGCYYASRKDDKEMKNGLAARVCIE